MTRVYKQVKTAIPNFWDQELISLFKLWLQDMLNGLQPYTPVTAKTFEKRFILYTRRQWEGKIDSLSLDEAFKISSVYQALVSYSIESYSNRHNMLYSIMSFAKFLVAMGRLNESFIPQLRKLRPKRVIPPKKTVIKDEAELKVVFSTIRRKKYHSEYSRLLDQTLIMFFVQSGLRVAELCRLNLEDVDLTSQVIHVYLGKGRKNRKVGITQLLKSQLEKYLELRLRFSTSETAAFFINRRGTRIKTADITRRMLKLSRLSGITITPHGLRRTFATLNANKGKPLNMIQLALGHSNIRTTQEYLMTNENQVIEAMKSW